MLSKPGFEKRLVLQSMKDDFLAVVQNAAIASYPWIGKCRKTEADGAATEAMRTQLNKINMSAVIVIGEGEMDEAPMLYIGEKLGTGNGPNVDIAVDPVEGTTLMSKGQDNSLAVIAVAERGSLLHAPDMYMEKLAVGPRAKGYIDIDAPLSQNMQSVAKALGKEVSDLTVMIQDRPRHEYLMKQVFEAGAKVKLFSDVDITGAVATAIDELEVDILVGMGGAPEGVIAAVALKCLGGDFQAKLIPQNQEEIDRCLKMGITDLKSPLRMGDIVKTDRCLFVATGITDGNLVKGIRKNNENTLVTHSFIAISGEKKSSHFIESRHFVR